MARTDRPKDKAKRQKQSDEVIRLWRLGAPLAEIAQRLGWGGNTARVENIVGHRVRIAGGALTQNQSRVAVADVALTVIDAMTNPVRDGDAAAANAMLKANDQLARLGGAYAPSKHMHGMKRIEDMTEDELEQFLAAGGNGDREAAGE